MPNVGLISIVVTLTIFSLGIAYRFGVLSARVDALESRLDRFEAMITTGLARLEDLIQMP